MSRALAEAVVDFMSFSGDLGDHLRKLRNFHPRDWEHTVPWLHEAGVALYFLQRLKQANATGILPMPALARLEQNLAANKGRIAFMSHQFNSINQRFNAAGVNYAAVKGFALVPQFCPDPSLRHQSDCDYLVDSQSLPAATRIVEETGYSLQKRSPRESAFLMPSARVPVHVEEQYAAGTAHAIELLLCMWDRDLYAASVVEPRFSLESTRTRTWEGVSFRSLPEEDEFLIQVTHAFNHILGCWIRMSWLYEIAHFLNQRTFDQLLWGRIEDRLRDEPVQREIVVVVTTLAVQFFGAPLPPAIGTWAQELRPAVRVWIENYSRKWAFGKNQAQQFVLFPTAKLPLFLHRQYAFDPATRRRLTWARLLPSKKSAKRLRRVVSSRTNMHTPIQESFGQQWKKIFLRIVFHVMSGLRYLWEIPRWWRLNQVARANYSSHGTEITDTV